MKRIFLFVLALILGVGFAGAQSQYGSVTGTITDPTGASVPGATVTTTNQGTGATRSVVTNAAGEYIIPDLPPQDYKITVSAPGFGQTSSGVFTIAVGSSNKVSAALSVKADSSKVDVTAESLAGINIENAEQSEVINTTQLTELPTETRDPYAFVSLAGNATSDPTGTNRGVGLDLGGARSASTEILLDGIENTQLFSVGVAATTPVDSVQEYRVITSNYGPEYGRASGGVVNVVTKAGTNAFHGSLWEFYRPSTFVSNSAFNKANLLQQGRFVRNEFGFVVGGPIIKNKLFFFGGNEWLRVRSNSPQLFVVPTAQFIAASAAPTQAFFAAYGTLASNVKAVGNPYTLCQLSGGAPNPATGATVAGSTCTGGPVVETRFGTQYSVGTGLPALSDRNRLEALAGGTFNENSPLFQLVQTSVPSDAGGGAPVNQYNPIGRLDFNMTDKTQMYARYVLVDGQNPVGAGTSSPYAGFSTAASYKAQNLVYGITHVFSSRLVSQVQLGLVRVNNSQPLGANPLGPTLFFNSTSLTLGGNSAVFPGYTPTSASGGIPSTGPQNDIMVSPTFTYTKGRHTMTFGGQYTYIRDNHTFAIYANAQEALVQSGSNGSLVNFQAGNFGYFQANINSQGKYPCAKNLTTGVNTVTAACTISTPIAQPSFGRSNRYQEAAGFFNEQFRANPRLTLNAGLRYELYGTQHNKNASLDSNFYFGTTGTVYDRVRNGQILRTTDPTPAGVEASNGKLWNTNYKQFAPRISFAYDVFGDGKTSFRGGYGISYERNFGNVTYNVALNPPSQFAISIANTDNGGVSTNPFSGTQVISTGALGPYSANTGLSKALPQATVRAVDPRIKPSYQEFYALGIERQLMSSLAVGLTYQGARGIHQYSIANYNRSYYGQAYEGDAATYTGGATDTNRLNPQYTSINVRSADGDSYYSAINLSLRASNLLHSGLTLTSNYTYGHTTDDLSSTFASDGGSNGVDVGGVAYFDPFNKGLDHGNADFDVKDRITLGLVYQTPSFGTKGLVREAVAGWEVGSIFIASTGTPFTEFDSGQSYVTAVPRARFLTPVPHARTGGEKPSPGNPGYYDYLDFPARGTNSTTNPNYGYYKSNTSATAQYADLPTIVGGQDTFNNATSTGFLSARNAFRGPGNFSFNGDLVKKVKLPRNVGLELRAELYNVLNHPNQYLDFGGTNDVNVFNYALTYKNGPGQGSNRQLQLAGKITF